MTVSDLVIQIVAISESVRLQQVLATYGIQTQTPKQIEPLLIWPPAELVTVGILVLLGTELFTRRRAIRRHMQIWVSTPNWASADVRNDPSVFWELAKYEKAPLVPYRS